MVGSVTAKGLPLSTKATRDWRHLVFRAVLIAHGLIVLFVIRASRLIGLPKDSLEPLILVQLRNSPSATADAGTPDRAVASKPVSHDRDHDRAPFNANTLPPAAPGQANIDWQHEAELATESAVANAETQKNYRDLSALSPEQLDWINRNHMEPMPLGIPWKPPRVEVTKEGLAFIWINDHCVYIPNGDLFKHMRGPH